MRELWPPPRPFDALYIFHCTGAAARHARLFFGEFKARSADNVGRALMGNTSKIIYAGRLYCSSNARIMTIASGMLWR